MVQQNQAHPGVLACLLLLVGQELPEDQVVPVDRRCWYRNRDISLSERREFIEMVGNVRFKRSCVLCV